MPETPPPPGNPYPGQSLTRVATTVYGSLVVLWLLVPGPVVDWWDEMAERAPASLQGLVAGGQALSRAVAAVSDAIHLSDAYPAARARMQSLVEK